MTPIGHLAVSHILSRKLDDNSYKLFIINSILPDIDFILLLFPYFNSIHRVLTHNLVFITIATLILFYFCNTKKMSNLVWIFLGGFLHLLIDSCLDSNFSNGIGVAFLYPFSNLTYSPYNFLKPIPGVDWSTPLEFVLKNLKHLLIEIPFYLISIYIVLFHSRK